MSAIERAAAMLYSTEGRSVTNVKFFMGRRREVTAEELACELLRAREQILDGTATLVEDIDGDLND